MNWYSITFVVAVCLTKALSVYRGMTKTLRSLFTRKKGSDLE